MGKIIHPLDVSHIIRSIVIITSVAALVFLGSTTATNWKTVQDQNMKNQAINECANISEFTVEELNQETGIKSTSRKPSAEMYKQCLEDKGYTQK